MVRRSFTAAAQICCHFFLGLPRSLPISQSRNAAHSLQKVLSTRLDTRAVFFFFLSFFSFSTSRELCGQTHTVHTPNADQTSSTAAVQQIRLPRASTPPTTQKRLSLRCENPHRERKQQQQHKEKSSLSASATSSRHSLCTTLSPKSHFCTLPILSRDLPQLGGGAKTENRWAPAITICRGGTQAAAPPHGDDVLPPKKIRNRPCRLFSGAPNFRQSLFNKNK